METTIHNFNPNDYFNYTDQEIIEQINDIEVANRKLRAKKWEYMDSNNTIINNDKLIKSIEQQIHNNEIEEMKLQLVLEYRGY